MDDINPRTELAIVSKDFIDPLDNLSPDIKQHVKDSLNTYSRISLGNMEQRLKTSLGEQSFLEIVALRSKVWANIDRAVSQGRIDYGYELAEGLCSAFEFRERFLSSKLVTAYIFRKPLLFVDESAATLDITFKKLREILELPLTTEDKNGVAKPNNSVINATISIAKLLMDRVHGTAVHRQHILAETRTHTHNTEQVISVVPNQVEEIKLVENLTKRLEALKIEDSSEK